MANGGANISRGMGRGAAQVYDTSGPVNMYAKLMQQQQLKRAAEQKALTDELGKVTPEGLRQPDVKGFIDQYGRWRDKAIEADAERNPTRKAILKQEAEREKLTTLMYKDDSKNELINERKRQEFLMNPENRNRYSKEIIAKIINSKNLSKDDIEYVRDMNKFEIKPDLTKIRKLLDDTDDNLMKYTKPTLVQEQGERLGVKGLYESNVTTLSPAEQATSYSVLFDTDEGEFKAFLRSLNPEFKDLSEKELKEAAIPILVQERPKSTYSDKKFIGQEDDREYQLRLRRENRLAAKDKDDSSDLSNYTVEKDTYLYTKPKEDKDFNKIEGSEKKSIRMAKSVGFDTDYFALIDAQAFDVENQKRNAKVSGNFIVGKLAYVPIEDGSVGLRAVVVNSDGNKYVVKPTVLPIGIRKSKNYKTALTALGSPPPPKGAKPTTKPTTKPTKPTSLKSKGGISFTVE
jgi:hypothetical protein